MLSDKHMDGVGQSLRNILDKVKLRDLKVPMTDFPHISLKKSQKSPKKSPLIIFNGNGKWFSK
jgi:hypothetical protein